MKINSCLITYPLVLILKVSKYCPLKLLIVQCTLILVIMTAYVMFEKKPHKKPRIVNIDKEKYEINSLHAYSCYAFICKEIFVVRFSKNQYKSTVHSQFL
jgi:hypothetical protein